MLKLPAEVRVFISLEPCDMRRQLDGLAALVSAGMARDPENGDLYIFFNRRSDMLPPNAPRAMLVHPRHSGLEPSQRRWWRCRSQ